MILGIECTAHTFGISLIEKSRILVNIRDMYRPKLGGIIPKDAAEHHNIMSEKLYNVLIEEYGIDEKKIRAIALSNAPGLAPCLLIGLKFAKNISQKLKIPIIEVNHCIAHLEIGRHEGSKDPVLLYASGANTQIIAYAAGKYRVFGETLDVGIGNFLDKVARYMEIPFPGGPMIEKLADEGEYIELPYAIKGMDVSFSGMQTKCKQLYDKSSDKEKIKKDISFSIQETAFAMLVEAAERAMAHTGKKELVLGGGVACNKRLQEMCKIMCNERGAKYFCPENSLLVDNAAMIAYTGELMLDSRNFKRKKLNEIDIKPRERTDDVEVYWR
jgi:glycoprotease/Kae1 family metallohydrolase